MIEIQVLNVGQGDCLILSPTEPCAYSPYDLFMDVGPGQRDVFQNRHTDRQMIILLSHAHKDHIGGLKHMQRFSGAVAQLWVPCYYDEVLAITDFILQLRGVERIPSDNASLLKAKYVACAADLLRTLAQASETAVVGCYEGMSFMSGGSRCVHLNAYNPPLNAEEIFGIAPDDLARYIGDLQQTDFGELRSWLEPGSLPLVRRLLTAEPTDEGRNRLVQNGDAFGEHHRLHFLYAFLLAYRKDIAGFVEGPSGGAFDKLFGRVRETSNNTSVILAYSLDGFCVPLGVPVGARILLTGDAEMPVFSRLMRPSLPRERQLPRADVLKMPHHGSRHAIDKRVLRWIRPGLAIVSHNNGRFGKQLDPHPHRQVVQTLSGLGITALYTNDVVKPGEPVIPSALPGPFPGWEDVVFVN
jgi:beta-lactamase superfamily II metal-dependent hydrolase